MDLTCIVLVVFVALLNLIAYVVVVYDKKQAQAHGGRANRRTNSGAHERIPEKAFHLLALFGGGLGGALAMVRWRHKTRKRAFQIPYVLATLVGLAAVAGWLLVCQ